MKLNVKICWYIDHIFVICLSQEDELKKAILVVFANKQVRATDFKLWSKWRMFKLVCRRKFEDFISEISFSYHQGYGRCHVSF